MDQKSAVGGPKRILRTGNHLSIGLDTFACIMLIVDTINLRLLLLEVTR